MDTIDTENAQPEKQDAFDGFGFTLRTFWVEAKDLRVGHSWRRETSGPDKGPKFTSGLHGTAASTMDGVCVIGGEEIRREFPLTLAVDVDAKKDWEWHKANDTTDLRINDQTPGEIIRIRKLVNERFETNPPTAILFTYDSDWELDIKAGWGLECSIPREVFEKIEQDLAAGLIQNLLLGIDWEAGLVRDKHAPPSYPTVWGMYRIGKSAEPLRGHLASIRWTPAYPNPAMKAVSDTKDDEIRYGERADPPQTLPQRTLEHEITTILNIPKSALVALWIIALSLIVLMFK